MFHIPVGSVQLRGWLLGSKHRQLRRSSCKHQGDLRLSRSFFCSNSMTWSMAFLRLWSAGYPGYPPAGFWLLGWSCAKFYVKKHHPVFSQRQSVKIVCSTWDFIFLLQLINKLLNPAGSSEFESEKMPWKLTTYLDQPATHLDPPGCPPQPPRSQATAARLLHTFREVGAWQCEGLREAPRDQRGPGRDEIWRGQSQFTNQGMVVINQQKL